MSFCSLFRNRQLGVTRAGGMRRQQNVGKAFFAVWLTGVALCMAFPARADLFSDNEARRAILDLRQRYQILEEENLRLHSNLQELQQQVKTLKADVEKSQHREEQLVRDRAGLQHSQKNAPPEVRDEALTGTDEIATKEGTNALSGVNAGDSNASPERDLFNDAINRFRAGDYAGAQTTLRVYLQRYPQSNQRIAAQYWLGNAEYALRNYRNAIVQFRTVVAQAPRHERAPEAMLSIAACQVELQDTAAAKNTLQQLIATYPQTGAAQAAQDRLTRLR